MTQCVSPGLLFIVCCRLTPPVACLTWMMCYPEAISHLETLKLQGHLPSIAECFHSQQELERPSAWGIAVPAGPRYDDGDLANTRLADLALILAFAFCQQGFKKLSVENLKVGIVITHNKTMYFAEQKLMGIWNRIDQKDIEELMAALNTEEDSKKLEGMLYSNAYDIISVP